MNYQWKLVISNFPECIKAGGQRPLDVRIVSGRCERALKLTLRGSCVDLCFGACCPKGTVETPQRKDGEFTLAAWNPLPGYK